MGSNLDHVIIKYRFTISELERIVTREQEVYRFAVIDETGNFYEVWYDAKTDEIKVAQKSAITINYQTLRTSEYSSWAELLCELVEITKEKKREWLSTNRYLRK